MKCWEVLNGMTFEVMEQTHLNNSEERYGANIYTIHRSDLHNEFVRLVRSKMEGQPDIELYLGSAVKYADAEEGLVELQSGSRYRADLIIGADGIHSVLTRVVVDNEQLAEPLFSGMNAFRFQIPTKLLEKDEPFVEMSKLKGKGSSIFADVKETESARHLVWYPCQR